jgi:tetratricopeptide (TPR) repeat protein
MANLDRAIELYRQAGDRLGQAQMMSGKSMIALSMGEFDTALPELEAVLAIQQELGDRAGVAKTLARIGLIYMENGPVRDGVEVLSHALALCDELGLRIAAVYTGIYLGYACLFSGDPTWAIRELEAAAELSLEMHFPEQHADTHEGRTFAHIALGQPDEALRHAERAVDLTGMVSSYQYEITTTITLGKALLYAGRLDEAMTNLLRAHEQADKMEFQFPVLDGELALASGYRQRGECDRATHLLETVIASTYRPYRGQAMVELARISFAQGNPAQAVEHVTNGLEIIRSCQYRLAEAHALWVLGETHRACGDHDEAQTCLRAATSILEEMGSRLAPT